MQDLGKVYYKPIRDADGTTVICTVNNVCQPKNVVNLKWTPMAKILKKSSRSDNLTDLLISSIQVSLFAILIVGFTTIKIGFCLFRTK